jgi:hypothetical protein
MKRNLVRRVPASPSLHRLREEGKREKKKTTAIHAISQSFHNIVYPYSQPFDSQPEGLGLLRVDPERGLFPSP